MSFTVAGEKSSTQGSLPTNLSLGWVDFMVPDMANITASTTCRIHRATFMGGLDS
jgi:hypothetical protein